MRLSLLFLMAAIGLSPLASAEIVFSLTPITGTTITPGNTQQFQVMVNSTLALGEQADALEFNAIAGIGDTIAGTFVPPTAQVALNPASPIDITSQPGTAFGSSFLSGGVLVPNSGIVLANLFLSTVGATSGNYFLSLDSLAANGVFAPGYIGPTALATSAGPSASYTIGLTAVPEPTSILTAAVLGGVGMFYRRRGSKAKIVKSRGTVKSKRKI